MKAVSMKIETSFTKNVTIISSDVNDYMYDITQNKEFQFFLDIVTGPKTPTN